MKGKKTEKEKRLELYEIYNFINVPLCLILIR